MTCEQRIDSLKSLKKNILSRKDELFEALYQDFGKEMQEATLTELMPAIASIDYFLKNLKDLMAPSKVTTPISFIGSRSEIHRMPKGKILIIAPWNYPFLLAMDPLVAAIAAGNRVDLAPSEMTPKVSQFIGSLIETSVPGYVKVHLGGKDTVQALLQRPYGHIFFTGSTRVGKIVMQAAANQLCPVTLELGGKSPAIIDSSAKIDEAAEKLIWAKRLNSSQTCVAPDYVYVHKAVSKQWYTAVKEKAAEFEVDYPQVQMITHQHFDRLEGILSSDLEQGASIVFTGEDSKADRVFGLKVLKNSSWSHTSMQEELFGPILPCLEFEDFNQVIETINSKPAPLASYLFSEESSNIKTFESSLLSGGSCVNHAILHLANHHLPFGGVGSSGMGVYHGKWGFEEFSHRKSVFKAGPIDSMKLFYKLGDKKKFEKTFKWLNRLT